MNLKNYVDMIIKLKVEPRKSDFLCSIVEAFIRDPFTTEIVENPLLKYENNNTLRAICNGNHLVKLVLVNYPTFMIKIK